MRRRRPFATRWRRPFIWHRGLWARWLWMGPFMLLLYGPAAYKLHQSDVERIQHGTGKSADALTEKELAVAMKSLGIRRLELTEEDRSAFAQPA